MSEDKLLEVSDLRVEFPTPKGSVRAADGVSFTVSRGEIVGLVGESGCGKSVTTLALMRLVRPPGRIAGGRILFKGRDILSMSDREIRALRGSEMAMIFQNPMTALDPVFTVGNHIAEVFRAHPHLRTGNVMAAAVEVLERVRIPNPTSQVHAYPHQFSGGMAQRVMIGMGLAGQPSLLIADEPTTALDVSVQAQILDLLRTIRTELKTAMILITHDLAITAQMCDRVVVMYAGQVMESSRTRDLFQAPRHPYTAGLLNSMPRLGHKRDRLEQIPGQPPDLRTLPVGCRFAPRCPRAEGPCHAEEPPLTPAGDGRQVRCHFPLAEEP
jgi:oligopeptide/dipeptide ABC transporter ATP-binding protein